MFDISLHDVFYTELTFMFAFVYLEHKGFFILNSHEIHTITIKVFLGTKQLHLCAVISRPQCFSFCLFL